MTSLRKMDESDIDAALELCRLAGWNQTAADWRRMLTLAPGGMFVDRRDGRLVATGSAIHYDTRIGWIGMILVHPDYRRRGIASAIMQRCIDALREAGVESIKLDATDQGRPVYLKLGFRDEQLGVRYAGAISDVRPAASAARPIHPTDWPDIARLDEQAFGADRIDLLKHLAGEGPAFVLPGEGGVRAYGFVRPGYHAASLGPMVALDEQAARAVAEALLADLPQGELYWDVLPNNAAAVRLAESYGLTVARRLTRMVLGDTNHVGRTEWIHAAAGFELG
ncbi:MAG: GNAT family N-acetyltransferase [Planctomycetes bacterium]|nr:GNAT family N-acetyltransferase [Planctomycetota bacterium]